MLYLVLISLGLLFFYFLLNSKEGARTTNSDDCYGTIKKRRRNLFFEQAITAIAIIVMFSLTALRRNVGPDTSTYRDDYTNIYLNKLTDGNHFEFGFILFCRALLLISTETQTLIIASAIICYISVSYFIFKECDRPLTAIILFFTFLFPFFMSGIREAIAIAILLPAYRLLKHKGGVKSTIYAIIIIVIAAQFHTVAYTALLLVPFKHIQYNRTIGTSILVFVALVSLFTDVLLEIYSFLFPTYARYMESDRVGTGTLGIMIGIIRLLILITVLRMSNYYKDASMQRARIMNWTVFICLWFQISAFTMNQISRVSLIFLLPMFADVINSVNRSTDKYSKLREGLMVVAVLGIFLALQVLRREWTWIYPYNFFWESYN